MTDKDADGPDADGADHVQQRTHNDANEITEIDPSPSSGDELALTYDKAGNLRQKQLTPNSVSGGSAYRYTHDAWNRLVKVQHVANLTGTESVQDKLLQQYNGLSWRTLKSTHVRNSEWVKTLMIYSAGWQILEEHIDDELDISNISNTISPDRMFQTIYGVRYIDDVVCRRHDGNHDGDFSDGADDCYYHLTDDQFSTVAVIDDIARLVERITYDAYGQPRHHWAADTDGDGDVDSADFTEFGIYDTAPTIADATYNVDYDINRDGTVDSTDSSIANAIGYHAALGKGILSAPGVGNVFG